MSKSVVSMPVVALRGMTVLPKMLVHFDIKRKVTVKSIDEAMSGDQKVFLVTQIDPDVDFPKKDDLHEVGTVANIKQVVKLPGNVITRLIFEYFSSSLSLTSAPSLISASEIPSEISDG
jgi:ATP-dependent Lon protease